MMLSLSAFNWVPELNTKMNMKFLSILLGVIWIFNSFEFFFWNNLDLLVGSILGQFFDYEFSLN